jgi:predicted N-acetyltransferase YhbS
MLTIEEFKPSKKALGTSYALNLYQHNALDDNTIMPFTWKEFTEVSKPTHGFIAKQEGVSVGAIILSLDGNASFEIWPSAYVSILAVNRVLKHTPKRVGQGVGRLLLETGEQLSLDHGFSSLALHSTYGAIGFYERMGYSNENSDFQTPVMRKDLLAQRAVELPTSRIVLPSTFA